VLNKEIPFLRICIPLCAGIITGLYVRPDAWFTIIAAILIAGAFLASLYFTKFRDNLIFGYAFFLFLFLAGLLLYNNEKSSLTQLKNELSVFSCTLSDYPEEKTNSCMLTVKLDKKITGQSMVPVKGSLVLYHKKENEMLSWLPGDRLTIECTPLPIVNRGNPNEFDYAFYMENMGIKYYAFTDKGSIIDHREPRTRKIIYRSLITRQKIIGMYRERGISEQRIPLLAAITLGEKSMLDREIKQSFIKAGIMHIMAVSGLHAVILSMFVMNLLFFLRGKLNVLKVVLTVAFLWSFAFVTGLTSSVLRATLMFTFIQAGNLMQRRVNGINSVLSSAFILILIRPSVIFDAGFLLSYSAVIYIIAFYSDLYSLLHFKNKPADWVWQSVVVTVIAQAGTLPLTIMLFNRFPVWFIFTNLIIVPLSSVIIIGACLIPILYPVGFLSMLLGRSLDFLTYLTEYLTGRAAALPGSGIENIGMTIRECVLLTIAVFTITSFLLKRKPVSLFYPLLMTVLFMIALTIKDIRLKRSCELIVYNSPGTVSIGLRTGKVLNLYSDTLLPGPDVLKHSATFGLRIKMNRLTNDPVLLRTCGHEIMICKEPATKSKADYKPDFVIFTGSNRQLKDYHVPGSRAEALIATSATSFPDLSYQSPADTVYLIRKSGAFRCSLPSMSN
jgi:competence protein ComEC